VTQSFLMSIKLAQKRADLHVDFAFIFKAFELSWCVALKDFFYVPWRKLSETSIQTETTFLQCTHFLKA